MEEVRLRSRDTKTTTVDRCRPLLGLPRLPQPFNQRILPRLDNIQRRCLLVKSTAT